MSSLHTMKKLASFTLVTLIGLSGTQLCHAQADQLYGTRGTSTSGKVIATTPVDVTIEVQGRSRKVAVNEIRRLSFAGEPPALTSARAKALAGNVQSALNELKQIDPASLTRELVRRDRQFYLAYCEGKLALTAGGDKAQASKSMYAFVKDAPRSHHFFEAAEILGDLAVSQQDYNAAVRYYGSIASKAPFPEYKLRGLILEGRALVSQGEFATAQAKFEQAIAAPANTAQSKRQQSFAQLGRARCLAETESPQAGLDIIEKLIREKDESDGELFGRAYIAQGNCYRVAGKPKEALMAFLHVDVLFYSDPDTHAEALYHLSKLWQTIKKPDRSNAARTLLDERYAGSVWAQRE